MSRILLLALLPLFAFQIPSSAQEPGWLPLAPTVVELEGRLLSVSKYGPPGYGENPKSDKKYRIPILLLQEPARVTSDMSNPKAREDLLNVSFVQLIFSNGQPSEYWRYEGQIIIVIGTLSRAQTGYHYTDVVMEVKAIRRSETKTRKNL